jgi:YVTN family beta-propeller protein
MRTRSISGWLALFSLLLLVGALLLGSGPTTTQAQPDEPTPRPLYALPDARNTAARISSTLALSDSLGLLAVANTLSNTVSIVAPNAGELRSQLPVGDDPRTVAITPDGFRAIVTNRADASLTVIDLRAGEVIGTIALDGVWPYGVVAADNETAYVSLQGNNEIISVNLPTGAITQRIATPPMPTGLALWGDFLYVTHLWSGDISLIYLPQLAVVRTISTGPDTGLSPAIDLDITRGLAYLPQSRANAPGPAITYDTTVFPVVNVVALSGLDLQRSARITPDTAARPVNMPFAVKLDPFRQWVYVANAGSNDLTVIDANQQVAIANIPVGANPRGVVLNGDSSRVYVHNVIDATISIIDTSRLSVIDTLPIDLDDTISIDVLIGAELFHTATDPRLSESRWVSCASCHFDGMSDGNVWAGFDDGPRNTPPLFDLRATAPYNWGATWDELADVELKIRALQAGEGLLAGPPNDPLGDPHAGLSLDLDTLVIYLDTLQGPASPYPPDTIRAARGRQVFEEQSCASCHALPTGTNQRSYDVGTGGTFDTPTIRWLWMSAPYFHDGSAETLHDVFTLPGAHQLSMSVAPDDINALVEYLLTLPTTPD